jgi:molecular chaperone DnaJ
MNDYYSTLGLDKDADDKAVKSAYRKKAREFHPDKNAGDSNAEKKFKEVQEAYEVLSDKQKRSNYDQFGQADGRGGFPGGGAGFDPNQFGGFADIFENFFGGAGGGRQAPRPNAPVRGNDIEARIQISFAEAVFGVSKHLELTKPETCDHCKGQGAEPGTQIKNCQTCQGQGQVRTTRRTILGNISSVHTCPECQGMGKIPEQRCRECKGEGRVRKTEEVSVKIPKGIVDGTTIRLKERGSAGLRGGPHGDLFLNVRVAEHAKFSREDRMIYSLENIHALQAVLGATVSVDTIHGKAELKIPSGTQNGTEFTLKGKGAPSLRTEKFGDHKVMINVMVPDKLSKKERELYAQLAEQGKINVEKGGFNLF